MLAFQKSTLLKCLHPLSSNRDFEKIIGAVVLLRDSENYWVYYRLYKIYVSKDNVQKPWSLEAKL